MDIIEISEENVEAFLPVLGEDLSEDVKRIYYNGIGATDEGGQPVGAFVYELVDAESEENTKSRICLARFGNAEVSGTLTDYYSRTATEENEVVESFYELAEESEAQALAGIGFSMEKKEDEILTITLEELNETSLGKKTRIPDHVGDIEDLSILQFRDAVKQILFKGHKGIMEDLPFLPKSWFDNKVSACVSSGDKTPGLFLVRRTPSGVLIPALLFAYGPEYQKNLVHMIRHSLQQALEIYPPETTVRISRKNAATRALTDKLLQGRLGAQIFFGTRKEK